MVRSSYMTTLLVPGKALRAAELSTAAARVALREGDAANVAAELDGLVVSMCGGADLHEGNPIWEEIIALSRMIVERGGIILNGGEDGGLMLATARAFPEATLGVLARVTVGNAYGPKAVVEDRLTRTGILTKMPVIIVFEGGAGTIEEWGRALKEIKNSFSDNKAAPKVFLHNYWRKTFDALWVARALPKRIMDHVQFFVTADEVMRQLSP